MFDFKVEVTMLYSGAIETTSELRSDDISYCFYTNSNRLLSSLYSYVTDTRHYGLIRRDSMVFNREFAIWRPTQTVLYGDY